MQNKNIIMSALASAVILGGIIWLGNLSKTQNAGGDYAVAGGKLAVEETNFDFGKISMAAGNVRHAFKIKNAGAVPVTVNKIYTSCMCTAASLKTAAGEWGPFGMPGHGLTPKLNIKLAPGAETELEAIFDPAAHGPAGVGQIERVIYLDTSHGVTELKIKALVTP
ncbi:hypothetical protein A3B19_00835 [Candidatus Giovannonibacteria bacterium RIFCSPLOWO2_01_FULL_46_32]|uniref:DUF1573 domain-containing protein n=1 Tax=Candidatus Giovannonibacteria bacterium RIFCSPLOWO2_01_FULL_46_32 TaxID=1798353 RepID=A0A1F5XGA4_9BACT|nr:MAG: hypothetical protein A3B19_00835 [Candidatus Giovannonibacteria bacterium RIFCSPLOWO2_01_FULL_46_32]